jgi:hypothetical protein
MDKRIIIGLILIILLVAAGAGCTENKSEEKKGPKYDEVDGEPFSESGWIDDDGNERAIATIPLGINASEMVTSITVKMRFEDSDPAHSETDDGSDPDEVTIQLSNGVMESESANGMTPCTLEVTMAPNSTDGEEEGMTGSWEISVDGVCNGNKPRFLFGFIIWIDQGIAYNLDVSYTFLEEKNA